MKISWKLITILTLVLSLSFILWSSTQMQALAHAQSGSETEAVVSLQAQEAAPAQAEAQRLLAAQSLTPTHDATVNSLNPTSSDNTASLGVEGRLDFGTGTCNSNIESYLKVDLSKVSGAITAGSLSLRSSFASNSGNMTMGLYGSTDDSWDEASVTWNSKPALDDTTIFATAQITTTGFDVVFSSSDELVTFLEAQRSGDKVATLGIVALGCDGLSVGQIMNSKEGAVAPRLDLEVAEAPNVELSPDMADSGNPGSTVNYSVQVTNTGNVADTFTITAGGNAWTTTPSPASVPLNPGISTTIAVSVMIPAGTPAGAIDTATIRATSMLSPTVVSDTMSLTTTANQVAGVDLSPDMTKMGVVGTTVMYSVQITNTGNGNDTFNLSVGSNSWVTTLTPTPTIALNAGASTTIMASVQVPPDATGGMSDMATITATSTSNGAVNDTTTLTTEAIAAAPGVETSPDMAKTGMVGTTISYMVPVTNTGNVVDTFTVTISAGHTWTTTLNASSVGPLNPGQSGMAIVSVSVPPTATNGATDTATIVATSMFSPTTSDSTDLTTTASVTPMPAVEISPETANASGNPGSTVNYSLQLTNTGNVADTFTITAAGNAWTTTPSPASVSLNAGVSTTIAVSVMIPAGTPAGASDTATIMATSVLSPSVSDASNLTTTANQVADVDLSPDATQTGVASTTVMYPVQVTNTGNGDDTFNLMVGNNDWTTSLSSASVGPLAAGQSMTVMASVEIPASASTGMSDTATITATSTSNGAVNDTITLTTEAIAAAPGVETSPDMAKTGMVSTTISYMVPVTNTGNVVDTFTVTISAGHTWTTTLNASSVGPLNPGQSGMAIVSVMIPADTLSGTIDTATIVATSMFSPTVMDSTDLTTTASVIPMPNVDLSPDSADSGNPGSTVNYTLQVTNTGNVADTFAVTAAGGTWTTNVSPASVTLNPGSSTTITAEVTIPADASAGETDTATIMATSVLSPSVSDASNLTTTANQVADVDLSPNATQTGVASTTVMYVVEVTNDGNGSDTFTLMVGNNSWPTSLSSASVGPLTAGQSMSVMASVQIPASASTGMSDMATITATSTFDGAVNDTTTLTTEAIAAAPGVETSPDMAQSGTVGTTISYMVPVTNTGNVVDTFTVTISAGHSWTTTLNASSVGPLNPGQSGMAIVSVSVPPTATNGATDTATIVATSMFSPTVMDSTDLTTTASVIPMPNVDLSPDMADSGNPGSTVNYSLQVTNTGNVADNFTISVGGNAWTTTPSPATVSLDAGLSTTIAVSVMIPAGTAAGASDTATIIATSVLSPSVSDASNLTTTANQVADVDLSPDATQTGIASTTVMYVVEVTNDGNGSDTFNLMVGNNDWTTSLSSMSVGPLAAGQSMTVMAEVQIPANASTGMTDMATITATSTFDGAVNDTTTLTTEAIAAAPGVDLSPDIAQPGLVGTTITYMVPVTNTGNVVDSFTVTVAAGHTWTTTLDVSSVGPLQPGESAMVMAAVSIPADAQEGMTDTATIIATSMFSPTISDSANLTTTASETPMAGVEISPETASASDDPGSTVDYTLQVMNTGNVTDTFTLTGSGNNWMPTVSPLTVTLSSGANITITVSVMIPAGTPAGMTDMATITATSMLSPTVSDSSNLTTTANQVAGVDISPDMAMTDTVGSMVSYMVAITNTGNGADTFDLAVSGETWTTNLSSASVTVNAGASTMVTVTVQIPGDADDGDSDMATVTATSQADSTVSDQVKLTTTANDDDGVSGDVEDGAPNNGDGNGDGIPDRQQANVASLPNATDRSYVTLESPAGTSLVNVTAIPTSSLPAITETIQLPRGIFDFVIDGVGVGGSAVVTLTLHNTGNMVVDSYWKYGPEPGNTTDHWYEFDYDGATGAQINGNTITLHFVDGERGDDDLSDDGKITDPGAPGMSMPPTSISLASFDGQTAMPARQAGLVLLATLMAGAGLLVLRRRQKGASTTN